MEYATKKSLSEAESLKVYTSSIGGGEKFKAAYLSKVVPSMVFGEMGSLSLHVIKGGFRTEVDQAKSTVFTGYSRIKDVPWKTIKDQMAWLMGDFSSIENALLSIAKNRSKYHHISYLSVSSSDLKKFHIPVSKFTNCSSSLSFKFNVIHLLGRISTFKVATRKNANGPDDT